MLVPACTAAFAQRDSGSVKETEPLVVTVTAHGDPVEKSYRRMILGMDLFERNRAKAPQATLRFKLLPRRRDTDMKQIVVEIAGDTFSVPVDVAADNTFRLERIQKALDEDAAVRSLRKAQTMTWRADIRTPGLPPNTRRLGDLRLECAVGMEADLVSNRLSPMQRIADLAGRTRDYCDRPKPRYFFFAERPVFSITFVSGVRRMTLPVDMLYGDVLDRPIRKDELAACDCEVLLDRAYFLPLGDRTWPDDTLVEFEYMDDDRVAVTPAATTNPAALGAHSTIAVGRSTKADVRAALGRPMAVPFETGFEVWAYRIKEPATPPPARSARRTPQKEPERETELVVVFAPSGIAKKSRVGPDVVVLEN